MALAAIKSRIHIPEWVVLLGALVLISLASVGSLVLQLNAPDGPPLSSRAYGITGGLAVARWIEAMGYKTRVIENRPYRIADTIDLLFVLQPSATYALSAADNHERERWVLNGGTLVVAVQSTFNYAVTRRGPAQTSIGDLSTSGVFSMSVETAAVNNSDAKPKLVRIVRELNDTTTLSAFTTLGNNVLKTPDDATTLATRDGRVIAAMRAVGAGHVIVIASPYPFSNEGLDNENNAQLVLSLLSMVAPGSTIGFDEYQHGSRQATSIGSWMLSAPTGQATLLALILLAIYIVWTGRRLGRVFIPPELRIRRVPSEYVIAMANLARAAGQQNATLLQYRRTLKQRLGRPYRIDPALADADFVAQLASCEQSDGSPADKHLLTLLTSLQRGTHSRTEFIRLAREAAEYRKT